jgi:hypothetical protein
MLALVSQHPHGQLLLERYSKFLVNFFSIRGSLIIYSTLRTTVTLILLGSDITAKVEPGPVLLSCLLTLFVSTVNWSCYVLY